MRQIYRGSAASRLGGTIAGLGTTIACPSAMLNRIAFLLAVFALAGCTSSQTSTLFKCEGGEVSATITDVRNSNVKATPLQTKKVVSTSSTIGTGLDLVVSECPIPVGVDRIIRVTLYDHPSVGKVYTLSTPADDKANYLTYTEHSLDLETITSKQEWIATGTVRVQSMVGQTIVLSTDNLIMRPRTDIQKNQAEGSFRMTLQIQADNVIGL
jgi:hypothetical protein